MDDGRSWNGWTAAHAMKPGDKVTIGPIDEEGIAFFEACGFRVNDGKVECVVTEAGISQPRKP